MHSEDDERFNEIQKMSMELKAESSEERAEFTCEKLDLILLTPINHNGYLSDRVKSFSYYIHNIISR